MRNHIYAFGSICRGEITLGSDIDLLACVDQGDDRFSSELYSIYTYDRIRELWDQGNPFAWHLALESRLIFSSDSTDFINLLGLPSAYRNGRQDCAKFHMLFNESFDALLKGCNSRTFNLSTIFLSIRNIATCYSLSVGRPIFSRQSALLIDPPVPLSVQSYELLERARILATRGIGEKIQEPDFTRVKLELDQVDKWMKVIAGKAK